MKAQLRAVGVSHALACVFCPAVSPSAWTPGRWTPRMLFHGRFGSRSRNAVVEGETIGRVAGDQLLRWQAG
jgi:hypothetical protein